MKLNHYIFFALFLIAGLATKAQSQAKADHPRSGQAQVDSIYFHLYTDSLKKGVHNYINVDGKLTDGRWLPLTFKDITFSASAGKWDGNSLIIDSSFKDEKVQVKAVLKSNPQIWKEVTIFMKTWDNPELLKTKEEVMQGSSSPARKNKRNRRGF
ncbi:hypothetical protein [Paraflavitalea sp. CAU 1676]|uniref:hypothetical protein n=1 Tax=Paraflavitalea sp. CAU 1676 TaxID=3032598 RepID=UPI0023DB59E6|nr:hypothetical protein [Paraflavitalea sp. CAU 1676]MDF2190181.1 hypothetical protein [Paraflavitalea sp. CAU 1676]